jgi:hypothetical protein
MRFYTKSHQLYCGIDWHARSLSVCRLNQDGAIMLHRHLNARPEAFLHAIAPSREAVVVAVEWPLLLVWAGRPVPPSIAGDLALIAVYERLLTDRALSSVKTAKTHEAPTFYRRRSGPGLGKSLSRVWRDDIHAIRRFPSGQAFVSSGRLGKGARASAGKRDSPSGTKLGNAALKWAFAEAAVLCVRDNPAGPKQLARLAKQHGKGQALTMLAHRVARTVYDLRTRAQACEMSMCIPGSWRGAGEPEA